ncbi:hypothetical protein BJ508DRAFT_311000 [Ascobolus immersus RN42]|uniref:Uncharacterized protein n=1 Tax=Ascobolus immersus RN42 TaxID=1160509 RepID=A0A3N4HRN9_ASCIM|nr:hypothetical protein BJ508DRAFT_311000 [Ascobolus immersus RN42]
MPFTSFPLELRALIAEQIPDWRDHMAYRHMDSANYHFFTRLYLLKRYFPMSDHTKRIISDFLYRLSKDPIFRLVLACGLRGSTAKWADKNVVLYHSHRIMEPQRRALDAKMGMAYDDSWKRGDTSEPTPQDVLTEFIHLNNQRWVMRHLVSMSTKYECPPGFVPDDESAPVESRVPPKSHWKRFRTSFRKQARKLMGRKIKGEVPAVPIIRPSAFHAGLIGTSSLKIVPDSAVDSSLHTLRRVRETELPAHWLRSGEHFDSKFTMSDLQDTSDRFRGNTEFAYFAELPVSRFLWRYYAANKVVELAGNACQNICTGDEEKMGTTWKSSCKLRQSSWDLEMLFSEFYMLARFGIEHY